MLAAVGSLDTSLLATVVKNALILSATFSLSKVVEPSTSKPIEVESDFSLDEVPSDFSVFQRSIFLWFVDRRQTTDATWWHKLILGLKAGWAKNIHVNIFEIIHFFLYHSYMRDSIILGTSDIFLDIWDCLNIVKNLTYINLVLFIDIALSAELKFQF